MKPVGAGWPLCPVTVPVTVTLVVGEMLPVMLAVMVEVRSVEATMVMVPLPEAVA